MDTITRHFSTFKMYKTKSEPHCELQTSVDNNVGISLPVLTNVPQCCKVLKVEESGVRVGEGSHGNYASSTQYF